MGWPHAQQLSFNSVRHVNDKDLPGAESQSTLALPSLLVPLNEASEIPGSLSLLDFPQIWL